MNLRTLLVLLPLVAASCADGVFDNDVRPAERTISVTVGSGPRIDADIESRTALGPDGVTVTWVKGDQIALWAEKDGAFTLDKHAFSLWHYNEEYNDAKFTADIPEMPEGTYNYYAVSPMPAATSGLKASYDIPAIQDGTYNPSCDVMVAQPVAGDALTEGDNSRTVNFTFAHKIHILRITIPTNNLGEDISALVITFPQPVAGRMTIDAANPDAAPELTNGNNTLTLQFPTPLKAGAVVYAMIAPISVPDNETISFTALGQTCETNPNLVPGKNFAAGHTTPIAYNIPVKGRDFTRLTFALPADLGTATLGEAVTKVTLTAPEGSTFDNGSNVREFTPGADGNYTIMLNPMWEDKLSGKAVSAQYESASAIVSRSITMPTIVPYNIGNKANLAVPYLFEENFDSVQTFSDNENKQGISDPDAIWLPGLSGWSAARTGGQAGQSVRIVGHREGAWGVGADYEARMDSAPLSCIKEGKTVSVKVSFNYSGSTNKGAPKFRYGLSGAQGLISGANAGIEAQAGDISASTNGSYENVNQSITPFTKAATNTTRLAWVAYGSDKTSGFLTVYFFYYIYIDNVKVSITQ